MNRAANFNIKRFVSSMALGLLIGASALGMGVAALASGGGGNGVGGSAAGTEAPANGTIINLSNFKQKFNGDSAKGKVTLGYAADGSAHGDTIPPFPVPTVGTTDIHIYSPDGTIEILGGSGGKLRP